MINFDPAFHEYTIAETGVKVRSVTQILTDAGLIDNRWYTEEARDRGSAIHALCERYANGVRLDDIGRTLDSLEYVNGFARWIAEKSVYALNTECLIYNMINGETYAGTFDILAIIGGKRILVDIKTGAAAKWHSAQLAGYSLGNLNYSGDPVNPDGMAVLYLKPDGRYQFRIISGFEMLDGIKTFKEALVK